MASPPVLPLLTDRAACHDCSFVAFLVSVRIVNCLSHASDIVFEVTKAKVAWEAKKATHFACGVTVIDMAIPYTSHYYAAYRAQIILGYNHFVKLFGAQSILD